MVVADPRCFRPTEVRTLLGDPTNAKEKLGWTPRITFDEMVTEMMENDLQLAKRDALVKEAGYRAFDYRASGASGCAMAESVRAQGRSYGLSSRPRALLRVELIP